MPKTPSHRAKLMLEEKFYADGSKSTLVGKNPIEMTAEEIKAAGGIPYHPLQAIRKHCLKCCCGEAYEVRNCTSIDCDLWWYRMGSNPSRKRRG